MVNYYEVAQSLVDGGDYIDGNENIYSLADIIGWMSDSNAGDNTDLNDALCAMATRSDNYDYTAFLQMIADFLKSKAL